MKISKPIYIFIAGLLIATAAPALAAKKSSGPEVTHFPTLIGYRGQPIPVYVKLGLSDTNLTIQSVDLHVSETAKGPTTKIPMQTTRERDHFSATIPASIVGASDKVWYFIAANDSLTNLTQTKRFPVNIKDPDSQPSDSKEAPETGSIGSEGQTVPAGETTGVAYKNPATEIALGAGAVAAAAVGVAVLDSGGGGGGSSFDDSNTVNVPSAGSSSGGFSSAPQDRIIDGSGAIGGRQITGVRVTLNYEAFNVPDRFQIIYEGSVIGDTGNVSGNGTIQATGSGSSPLVTIRVITESGGTLWEFTANVEYSVVEPVAE